jgi:hypothetical protein
MSTYRAVCNSLLKAERISLPVAQVAPASLLLRLVLECRKCLPAMCADVVGSTRLMI